MKSKLCSLLILWLLMAAMPAMAVDYIAVVIKSSGNVKLQHPGNKRTIDLKKGQILQSGDRIVTGQGSFSAIKFLNDKSLLRIKENSECVIEGKKNGPRVDKNIFVKVGSFFASLFKPRGSFRITTPTSVASVKGTEFWTIQFQDGHTMYMTTEGAVDLTNNTGKALLRAGWTAVIHSMNDKPQIRLSRPEDFRRTGENRKNQSLEVEFKNEDGQVRRLKIEFEEK